DRDRKGMRRAHPREDRAGRGVQACHHRRAAAEDALGKDPTRNDQENRRRRKLDHAGNDRGSESARRNRGGAERQRSWRLGQLLDVVPGRRQANVKETNPTWKWAIENPSRTKNRRKVSIIPSR